MIGPFIAIQALVAILGLWCYWTARHAWMMICITFLLTNGYMLIPEENISVKGSDFTTMLLLIITAIECIRDPHHFYVKNDAFGKVALWMMIFQVLVFIITLATKAETTLFAIKVARINILYIAYFIFRKIPCEQMRSYFFINMKIAIVMGVLFYLQLFDVRILQGRVDEARAATDQVRYANAPFMAGAYLLYSIFSKQNLAIKLIGIVYWGGMMVLGMSRGGMLGMGAVIVAYLILSRNIKYAVVVGVVGLFAYLFVLPMFQYRDNQGQGVSTTEDIRLVFQGGNAVVMGQQGGTFSFRIGMLLERWDYLIDHPQYLLTGVGDIHEDSPRCYRRFKFVLGTVNAGRKYGQCLIESGDIAWVPLLLRYGVIGMVLYLSFFVIWARRGIPYVSSETDTIYIIFALMVISTFMTSFTGGSFQTYSGLYTLLFHVAYVYKRNKELDRV